MVGRDLDASALSRCGFDLDRKTAFPVEMPRITALCSAKASSLMRQVRKLIKNGEAPRSSASTEWSSHPFGRGVNRIKPESEFRGGGVEVLSSGIPVEPVPLR